MNTTRRQKTTSDRKESPLPFTNPFDTAEEAWFWFILAQQARNEGAQLKSGLSRVERPCEPADILAVLDKLYRHRRLCRDHLLVLRHYGRRQLPPDPSREKEYIASKLWREAIQRLEDPFIKKGIVRAPDKHPSSYEEMISHVPRYLLNDGVIQFKNQQASQ